MLLPYPSVVLTRGGFQLHQRVVTPPPLNESAQAFPASIQVKRTADLPGASHRSFEPGSVRPETEGPRPVRTVLAPPNFPLPRIRATLQAASLSMARNRSREPASRR